MTAGFALTNVVNGFLNAIRGGGTNLTAPATTYAKLHVGDPGAAGTANPSAGDATRKAFTQAAASSTIVLNGTPPVWTNGGSTEDITHISVWDAVSAGNFLYSIAVSVTQHWVSTNTLTLTTCTVGLTPIAA